MGDLPGPSSNVASTSEPAAEARRAQQAKGSQPEEKKESVGRSSEEIAELQKKIHASLEAEDAATVRVKNRFNPFAPAKKTWDFVLMFIIFYSVIVVPYRISFDVEATGLFKVADFIFDFFFFADIVINFFTMYEDDQGKLEADLNKIAKQYLRGWFLIDLVSTVPFDQIGKLFTSGDDGNVAALRSTKILRALRLIKLVRLLRLLKLEVLIEMAADALQVNSKYLMLSSLVFYQFFFAHLIACLWYSVAKVQKDFSTGVVIKNEDMPPCSSGESPCIMQGFDFYSWVYAQNIQDASPAVRYMYSLYWTYATMTTVGYGDVSAANTSERQLSILLMVLGVTMFGYTLLMVALVLLDGDPREMQRKMKMRGVEHYLSDRKLGKLNTYRIKTHFQDLCAHQEDIFEDRPILFFLHPSYRYRVLRDINANNWPSKITFLKQFESPLRAALYKVLKPCICDRGDVMFYQGEIGFQLYFLYDGAVVLKRQANEKMRSIKLDKQGVFGEVSMVSSHCRPYTALCVQLCHIAFMNKDEVYAIAEDWPQWLKALCDSSVFKMDLLLHDSTAIAPQKSKILPDQEGKVEAGAAAGSEAGPPQRTLQRTVSNYISPEVQDDDDDVHADAIEKAAIQMFKEHRLIHPRYWPKIVWDIVVGVFIMYSVIFVPYRLGFGVETSYGAKVCDRISDMFFFVDILLTFRTTYLDDNCQYITSGGEIACDYLKSWFIIDFFSTVPIDIIAAEAGNGDAEKMRSLKILRVLRLFKLLKLLRLFKLKRLLGKSSFEIPPVAADFLRHLFVLIFLTHLGSCIWYGVAFQDRSPCAENDEHEWPPPPDDGEVGYMLYPALEGSRRLLGVPDEAARAAADDAGGMYVPHFRGLAESRPAAHSGGSLPVQAMASLVRIAVGFATGADVGDLRRRLSRQKTFYEENGHWEGLEGVNRTWPDVRYYGGWFGRNMTEYESDWSDRHDGFYCDDRKQPNWVKGYSAGPSYATFVLYDHLDNVNVQYISAMYWCFATFLSVGYGDVTATVGENTEIFVSIVGMSMGTICFAMFLSSVCMFVRLQMQKAEFNDMLARVKDYLRESALSKGLQKKVRSQFEMYCNGPNVVHCSPFYDEKQLVDAMPTFLGYEAAKKTYTEPCMAIPFVRELEGEFNGFLMLIAQWLFPMNLGAGECVYKRGVGHQYVFFIRKGSVEVMDVNDSTVMTLNTGKFFGEGILAVPFGHIFRSRYSVYTTVHSLFYGLHRNFFRRVSFMSGKCGKSMIEKLDPESKVSQWFEIIAPA